MRSQTSFPRLSLCSVCLLSVSGEETTYDCTWKHGHVTGQWQRMTDNIYLWYENCCSRISREVRDQSPPRAHLHNQNPVRGTKVNPSALTHNFGWKLCVVERLQMLFCVCGINDAIRCKPHGNINNSCWNDTKFQTCGSASCFYSSLLISPEEKRSLHLC